VTVNYMRSWLIESKGGVKAKDARLIIIRSRRRQKEGIFCSWSIGGKVTSETEEKAIGLLLDEPAVFQGELRSKGEGRELASLVKDTIATSESEKENTTQGVTRREREEEGC